MKNKLVCASCNQPIKDENDAVHALGNTYHPHHFTCYKCNKVISDRFQPDDDGHPYCPECTAKYLKIKLYCALCKKELQGKGMRIGDQLYHPQCFKCAKCQKVITEKFQIVDGKPYCEQCFVQEVSGKCYICGKMVTDEIIKSVGHFFHVECFKCAFCKKSLIDTPFKQHEGKMVCELCFRQNFGPKCKGCGKAITTSAVLQAIGSSWHVDCFKCIKCGTKIADDCRFSEENGMPVCNKCAPLPSNK